MYMCEIEPIYMSRTMNINEHLRVYTKVILCKDIPMLHMCIHVEMEVDMHGSTEIVLLVVISIQSIGGSRQSSMWKANLSDVLHLYFSITSVARRPMMQQVRRCDLSCSSLLVEILKQPRLVYPGG